MSDLTASKKAKNEIEETSASNFEDASKELSEIKHALAESTIVAFTDQRGKITYVNDKFCEISKYSREELIGEDHRIINSRYHPKEFFQELWTTIANGKIWRGEIRNRAKDSSIYWVSTTIIPFLDKSDKPYQYAAIRHDITERKEGNERIRQQASLLDKTRDAILVCDLNHKIIFFNRGAEKIYGRKAEDVLGKEICEITCKGDQTIIEKALTVLEKSDEWQEETINFSEDGKKIIVISRWTLVRNELGQPDYFLINNTDITDLKHTEHQLLRAQRLESIGTLAGGISHDLNNVLSPILMAVEMLQTDLDLPESSKPWLSIIRENTERGADLLRQVLTFARGAAEGNQVDIQVEHIIKEQIKVLKQTLPQNINIEFRIDSPLALVNADPTHIHQVLMNLAVNAKDAMSKGGTLKITAENTKLDVNYAQINPHANPGNYILIKVEDSGTGMSAEILERIWDPFYTTKDVGKGTGLGLSTALSIVSGHGGFINAYSEKNRGTQFSVYLPALEIVEAESVEKQMVPYLKGNGELILIVDDEEHIRQIVSATLEKYGYKTLVASDGTEALVIYTQQEKIDLVITDMAMPYMDGAATIRALRKINPNQKIIFTSGLTSPQEAKDKELAVSAYLAKPFTSENLLAVISKVLGNKT